ncbi:Heavy metal tolerance protein [Tolypocladium ophioglossoides CBS 100239]|uniref:Heavy metal tolerance protein n=1 Tax=Tolypocladium ophioglossoides (strain CBS 100239) TaxID=1163406 RepID=A0A0L0N0B1_TOLOC|nr:Heavy metal tolerance protein [Tolypocladium ophioglossoides CBS 100239]
MDPATEPDPAVLPVLYYTYPAVVFLYFIASSLASACTLQRLKIDRAAERPGRRIVLALLSVFILSYVAQLATLVSCALVDKRWPPEDHLAVGILSCLLIFGIQLSWLSDADSPVGFPFHGSWLLALAFEAVIGVLVTTKSRSNHPDRYELAETAFSAVRFASLLVLIAWSCIGLWAGARETPDAADEERQSLLPKDGATAQTQGANGSGYGATTGSEQTSENTAEYNWERREREAREAMEKRLKEGGNWFEYAKGFMILFPYVYPIGNRPLQLRAGAVVLCLFGSNALHLLIPRQTGIIMDSLAGTNSASPWLAVIFFAALRLAASESGIELLRQWLWIPVKYYAHDSITRAAYSHMMHLSADFHDSKSSSDMMMAIYGGSAVSNVVESVLLQAAPMLIDMCVAIVYLSITFGPYEGLITVATGTIFFMLAGRLVAESKAASRKRVNALYQEHYVRQSGLLGWQTVSAFNQIGYEDNRHANAVTNRWVSEQQYVLSWYVSIAFQTMVLTCGLLVSAFLAVSRIQSGHATSGQFAMLLMYWSQLTSPLQFFAKLGKSMSDDFIDAERLLDIMKTKPTVENKKGARPLKFAAGNVEFEAVCFSYDGRKGTIKDMSLSVPAGETVAFVGATGAGKSTLLKLLDRFYDVTDGCIRIDGQDIREVDLFSLRDRIGIVPQNPILFDDTIMNNVRYGRITASDEEVFEACQAACIHDKIKGFTNGYETRVGERGVKLSGGELQRVAIARAILKKPDIVLLDEATSAVDTDTEQQIQQSFRSLCHGRTTFIVAHRLSTIMNADRIVVVEHGELIEQGSHHELVAKNGRYADLWSKQVFLRPREKTGMVEIIDDRPDIADDLSSEQTAADHDKGGITDSDSEMFCTDNEQAQADVEMPQQHMREGSKLNPDAPEFTPLAVTKADAEPAENVCTPNAHAELPSLTASRQWSDEVAGYQGGEELGVVTVPTNEEQTRPKGSMPVKDGAEHLQKVAAQGAADSTLKASQVTDKSKASGAGGKYGVAAQAGDVELKHPRYSRRVQSKSEPSQVPQEPEPVARLPAVPTSIVEAQEASRRVSAPPVQPHVPQSQLPRPTSRDSALLRPISTISEGQGDKLLKAKDKGEVTGGTACSDRSGAANPVSPVAGDENDPPPKNGQAASSNTVSARGFRGGRRGRSSWLRSRRGRVGPRVEAAARNSQAQLDR